MKYGVSKNTLLITAGIIWLTAGINILRIGVECWINDSHYWLFKACEATLVFLLFFGFIFRKLYRKHTHRISQKKKKNCPFSFFDVQGWIVMAFMITIGILSRRILYRTFPRTNRYRYPIHYLLVEKQTLASISQVLLPLYFIEKATSLQAAFQIIFFPTGLLLKD